MINPKIRKFCYTILSIAIGGFAGLKYLAPVTEDYIARRAVYGELQYSIDHFGSGAPPLVAGRYRELNEAAQINKSNLDSLKTYLAVARCLENASILTKHRDYTGAYDALAFADSVRVKGGTLESIGFWERFK